MVTSQESADLVLLQAAHRKEKESAWSSMRYLLSLDATGLVATGYATAEEGVADTMHRSIKKVEDLTKAHIRKYPD